MSRTHFLSELEAVGHNLILMGDIAKLLFDKALRAISSPSLVSRAEARELETQLNHQRRRIHDQCLNLIILQAPVARDARFVTGVLHAIVDLELIGDYSHEIATLTCTRRWRTPTRMLADISEMAAKVREVLTTSIDGWHYLQMLPSFPYTIRA